MWLIITVFISKREEDSLVYSALAKFKLNSFIEVFTRYDSDVSILKEVLLDDLEDLLTLYVNHIDEDLPAKLFLSIEIDSNVRGPSRSELIRIFRSCIMNVEITDYEKEKYVFLT